jgi:carboxylesterase type B
MLRAIINASFLQDLSDAPLPVMVWFFGGGYTGGGNVQYPGHFLAARGVIVVVPNYRLGAFGKHLEFLMVD